MNYCVWNNLLVRPRTNRTTMVRPLCYAWTPKTLIIHLEDGIYLDHSHDLFFIYECDYFIFFTVHILHKKPNRYLMAVNNKMPCNKKKSNLYWISLYDNTYNPIISERFALLIRFLFILISLFLNIKTQQAIFQTDDLRLPPDRRSGPRYRYINNALSLAPFFKTVWGRCKQVPIYPFSRRVVDENCYISRPRKN